jgi:integrase
MARRAYAIRLPRVYKAKARSWPDGRARFHWVVDLRRYGKGSRLFFDTEEEARMTAKIEANKLMNEGLRASQVEPGLREEAIRCQELLKGCGVSLTDAVGFYLKNAPRKGSKTLQEAVELFLASRVKKVNRDRSVATYKSHLEALITGLMCGHPLIHEVTTQKIEKYFEGKKLAPKTINNHLGTLKTFFEFCLKHEWCAQNPAEPLEKAKIDRKTVGVFTPAEARKLLNAAATRYADTLAVMAIGLLSGVRSSELMLLEVHMIKLAQRIIDIPAEISKTRKRRLVPISKNLLAWLKLAPLPTQGRVFQRPKNDFYDNYVAIRAAAGVAKKENGMRHSFATYHLAMYSNVHETSRACGHSVQILLRDYDAVATKAEGKDYWAIWPQNGSKVVSIAA